jgi:drug/metabolite transporter (DMT)-like permease
MLGLTPTWGDLGRDFLSMPFSTSALLYSLGALSCFGFSQFLSAPLSRRLGPLKALFLFQLLGVPLLLMLLPTQPVRFELEALLWVGGLGLLCTCSMLLYFHALRVGQVSVVVSVNQAYVLVALVVGFLAFNESLATAKLFGIALLLLGMTLVALDFSSGSERVSLFAGVGPALLAALASGFYFVGVGHSTRNFGWLHSALGIRLSMSLLLGLLVLGRRCFKLRQELAGEPVVVPQPLPWKVLLPAVACDVLGFCMFNLAVARAEISYVTAIISAASLLSIFLSWRFLGEVIRRYQILGAVLVVLALVVISLAA